MKKFIYSTVIVLVLFSINAYSRSGPEKENSQKEQALLIQCSPDLYNLVQQWVGAYYSENQSLDKDFFKVEALTASENVQINGKLLFVSNQFSKAITDEAAMKLVVGRDVLVPVINVNNPAYEQMRKHGMTMNALIDIVNNNNDRTWISDQSTGETIRFNYYQLTGYLSFSGSNQLFSAGNNAFTVANPQELVSSVQHDKYGLGICRLKDLVNTEKQSWVDQIALLPIDKNANGKLDYFEKIYDSPADFTRGIWIGKYPKSLVNNFYVIAGKNTDVKGEIAFMRWLINDGQDLLLANGFNELVYNEKRSNLSKLENLTFTPQPLTKRNYFVLKVTLVILIAAALVVRAFSFGKKSGKSGKKLHTSLPKIISESTMRLPEGLFFDKTHTWVFMDKDGIVKVGIDDFLQHVTGPITRIKMKEPGENLKKNDVLMSLIQDGKQLNIYAPISGKITGINEILVTSPEIINNSPYAEGWVYTMKPSNYLREIQFLRMAEKYRIWLKNEVARLKDFLAVSSNIKSLGLAQVTYQEGGEINDNILHDYGPEVWEDFQKKFIDTATLV